MFQQSTEICLRAFALVISAGRDAVVQSREIGDRLGISATYVTKALQPLARQGWLQAIKGRGGGWKLAVNPKSIKLARVIEVLEPNGRWKKCVLGHFICSDETSCPFHHIWKETLASFEEFMRGLTLDRLSEFLPPDVRSAGGRRA